MWAVTSTFCPSSSANTYTTLPNALCFVIGQWHLYMQRKVPRLQLFLDFNSGSWGAWGWCILVGAAACSIPSNLSLLGLSLLGKREQITHLLWAQRQLITHCNLGMISSFLSPSLSPSLCLRFKLSLFTTTSYYYTLLLLLMKSSGLQTSSSLIRSYCVVSLPCRLPLCPKISAPLSNQTLVSRQISSGLVLGKEVINYHITRLLY